MKARFSTERPNIAFLKATNGNTSLDYMTSYRCLHFVIWKINVNFAASDFTPREEIVNRICDSYCLR